ncbi:response regulator [Arthrobacter sp. SA17]
MPRTAIIADHDAGRLASVGAVLSSAGYAVATASDQQALAKLLADQPDASIVVLDQSFAEAATTAPILLLVDLADGVDAASGNRHAVADFIVKPPSPQELVFRADSIIRSVAARSEARQHAERLRERLRDVSAAIRTTNDPRVIADHVVNGFGKTFEADRVLFTTFEDQRVPGSLPSGSAETCRRSPRAWRDPRPLPTVWQTGCGLKVTSSSSMITAPTSGMPKISGYATG